MTDAFVQQSDGFEKCTDKFATETALFTQQTDGVAVMTDVFVQQTDGFAKCTDKFATSTDVFTQQTDGLVKHTNKI